jgi:hypothetical protein
MFGQPLTAAQSGHSPRSQMCQQGIYRKERLFCHSFARSAVCSSDFARAALAHTRAIRAQIVLRAGSQTARFSIRRLIAERISVSGSSAANCSSLASKLKVPMLVRPAGSCWKSC